MNKTHVDPIVILTAIAGIVGSGVLSLLGSSIEVWAPGWGLKTVQILTSVSYGAALLVFVINNRTPTNSIVVHDQATGSLVKVATVDAPASPPQPQTGAPLP